MATTPGFPGVVSRVRRGRISRVLSLQRFPAFHSPVGSMTGACDGRAVDRACRDGRPFLSPLRRRSGRGGARAEAVHPGRSGVAASASFVAPAVHPPPLRPNQSSHAGLRRRGGKLRDLARGGVFHAPSVTRRAVRSYRTFSPLPDPLRGRPKAPAPRPSAVSSLWHCPAPATETPVARRPVAGGWALPTAVFCRARTFLRSPLPTGEENAGGRLSAPHDP